MNLSRHQYQDTAQDEGKLQEAVIRFLDASLPSSYRAFAVPNGGKRSAITGAILKRQGVKAGVPDICIVQRDGVMAFLELKTSKGTLSPAQKEFRDWCGVNSIPYALVRSVGDVQAALLDWNIPIQARAA